MEDHIAQVHAAKKKKTILGTAVAAVCILLLIWVFVGRGNDVRELTEAEIDQLDM